MSKRYGDRGFGRYGDPEDDRTEDRDYGERDVSRGYGETGERYGREYGAARRGGGYPAARGEYGRERESGARDYFAREYGPRYGAREYGAGDYGSRYGREGLAGGYAGSAAPRRPEGEDYGRGYAPRPYGRDAGRVYERVRAPRVHDDEGVRDYDTDYGRTTSRFYGRSGYEYGREDYDRDDDDRDDRRAYGARGYAGRDDDRGGSWLDRAADQVRSWFGGDDADDDDRGRRGPREEFRARGGRGEGKFRGRGPKNYRRPDERVREEVCDRLTDNEWLDASDVEVSVVAGEVILTGMVDSRYAKRLAENVAESVGGVLNVQNNLRVHSYQAGMDAPLPAPTLPAGDITAAAATDTTATSAPDPDPGLSSSRAAGRG
jgi:osmotically-inducible protein OsmY